MKRWEYHREFWSRTDNFDAEMNTLGQLGWEAYSIELDEFGYRVYFKRGVLARATVRR